MAQIVLAKSKAVAAGPLCGILREIVDGGDDLERCLSIGVAARIKGSEAREILIKCLHCADPDVRGDAGSALGYRHGAEASAALADNLKDDPCGENKVVYIQALQTLGASSAVKTLQVLVRGRGQDDGIFWDEDDGDWDDWLDVQRAAIKALGHLSKDEDADASIAVILDALADPDGQDLWAIGCRALARLGEPGCNALENLLVEASALNRKRIATALGSADCAGVEDIILHLLHDSDAGVRIAAVETGGELKSGRVRHEGLENTFPGVRAKTLEVFDDLDQAAIAKALSDIDPGVRIAACRAIGRAGNLLPGVDLLSRAQKQLRSSSPEYLAELVAAMTVAEPDKAAEFVEEIANHQATKPVVRLAAIRALGKLGGDGAVDCLAISAADKKQDIRLEAIVALGRIAKTRGASADRAASVLASAIVGEHVPAPPDWKPGEDDGGSLAPKSGHRAMEEQGEGKVQLNREGEPVSEDPEPEAAQNADSDTPPSPMPLSTLEAIIAYQPAEPAKAGGIELDSEDIAFLEMTGSRIGKRKIDPQKQVPAHIDVCRLAARIAGETGKAELVEPLAKAAVSHDTEVCETALDSLSRLASGGVDISPSAEALLQQSGAANAVIRRRALEALGWIKTPQTGDILNQALNDPAGAVRAAALQAISISGGTLDELPAYCGDEDRRVRQAAATLISKKADADTIPALLNFAMIENAVHKEQAADLLAGHGEAAILPVLAWVRGDDQTRRIVGLEMLARILGGGKPVLELEVKPL